MTPRNPLPRAALSAVREATIAVDDAGRLIRQARRTFPRSTPGDSDLGLALDELLRARRLLDEATNDTKGGAMRRSRPPAPTIGADVLYFDEVQGGPLPVVYAAKIAGVDLAGSIESTVSLAVFGPDETRYLHHVPRGRSPGCWDWPER